MGVLIDKIKNSTFIRRKVKEFLADIESGKSTPLKNITSDYHYHTVTADSEETLGLIEEELRKLGFLVEN